MYFTAWLELFQGDTLLNRFFNFTCSHSWKTNGSFIKEITVFRCHAWRHTMNWSLRKFSHAERTGEQLADSSNDSNNVGRVAVMYRLVYSCRTSINFSDITTRWKNQPPQEEVSTFWKKQFVYCCFSPKTGLFTVNVTIVPSYLSWP